MSPRQGWGTGRLLLLWIAGVALAIAAGVAVAQVSFGMLGPSRVAAGESIGDHWLR